jgi:hypothetical protein
VVPPPQRERRQNEFVEWVREHTGDVRNHTRPRTTYLGTWLTVGGLGEYSGEIPWAPESCATLGEDRGHETAQRLLAEIHRDATLLGNVDTANVLPDT